MKAEITNCLLGVYQFEAINIDQFILIIWKFGSTCATRVKSISRLQTDKLKCFYLHAMCKMCDRRAISYLHEMHRCRSSRHFQFSVDFCHSPKDISSKPLTFAGICCSLLRLNELVAALAIDNWMNCGLRNIPNLISHSHFELMF